MLRLLPALTLGFAITACSAKDESPPKAPVPASPPAAAIATASIASLLIMDDCPDPPETEMAAASAEEGESEEERQGDSDRMYEEPCTQSTVQIAFAGQGEVASPVAIKEVRLLGATGETLALVKARVPTMWRDNAYLVWDQIVPARTELKASYKLSHPDWSAVEGKLGGSSYGPSYRVEVDLEIGGTTQTLLSNPVVREQPEMIET